MYVNTLLVPPHRPPAGDLVIFTWLICVGCGNAAQSYMPSIQIKRRPAEARLGVHLRFMLWLFNGCRTIGLKETTDEI